MNEEEKIIKAFLTEMAAQDNRCTAFPYYYTICDFEERAVPEGCGEYTLYVNPEYGSEVLDSKEQWIKRFKEDGVKDIEQELDKLEPVDFVKAQVFKGMFLTETDAEEHLKNNHYHYSDKAYTYVQYVWRAPKMEQFFKALFKIYGIPLPCSEAATPLQEQYVREKALERKNNVN